MEQNYHLPGEWKKYFNGRYVSRGTGGGRNYCKWSLFHVKQWGYPKPACKNTRFDEYALAPDRSIFKIKPQVFILHFAHYNRFTLLFVTITA
jgi:hypothetical protein